MLLQDIISGHRLILASASPRRRQLLTGFGIEFDTAPKFGCREEYPDSLPPEEVAGYLSRLKSNAYPEQLEPGDILLTADTTVLVDGRILGKPVDEEDAAQMLRSLSGRSHTVVTGVTLRSVGHMRTFSAESRVRFRKLGEDEIGYYVSSCKPLDKAGAYGIQEWIGYVGIEGIEGSFYNVMGLPLQRLYVELLDFIREADGTAPHRPSQHDTTAE